MARNRDLVDPLMCFGCGMVVKVTSEVSSKSIGAFVRRGLFFWLIHVIVGEKLNSRGLAAVRWVSFFRQSCEGKGEEGI